MSPLASFFTVLIHKQCLIVRLLADLDLVGALKLSSNHAPTGFSSWLDRHLETHDPIMRSVFRVQSMRHAYAEASAAVSPGDTQLMSLSSHKCWNDRCMHYIYGFASQIDRDHHMRTHSGNFSKRDSGLSVGTTPPLAPQKLPSIDLTKQPMMARPPRPGMPSNHPSLMIQTQTRERPGASSSIGPSTPARSATRAGRGDSVESEVDPLLPPIKKTRVGHSRLQSIGELQLLRDNDPCLRCKASHKAVRTLVIPFSLP